MHATTLQVRPSERIAAAQQLPELEARLRAELTAQGIDPDAAAQVDFRRWGAQLPICLPAASGVRPALVRGAHTVLFGQPCPAASPSSWPVQVEDDSVLEGEVRETGHVDERGQLVRPWCPATRILEQREAETQAAAAEAKRRAAQEAGTGLLGVGKREPPPRTCFPDLAEGQPVYQKNEGGWGGNARAVGG